MPEFRYAAFISYNHRDRKQAVWLHRALEAYRLPRHMQGRRGPFGPLGAKLPPIFRDRDELAASANLAKSVRDALDQSYSLIVICSPNGAKSEWVNEEIRTFAALGRADQIQCLIISGSPHASERADGDPAEECFPPALFEHGPARPLAADLRPDQDGPQVAKLKLLAGILGVGYDELRQREQARRVRRLSIAAAGLAVAFLMMTGLAAFALVSRAEAVRQRDIARQKTLTAERTVTFVKSLFEVADPSEARGQTITAREILDRGTKQLQNDLAGEPTVKAELTTTLGEVYGGLGLFRQSEALVRRTLTLPGVDDATRARQFTALGEAQWRQGDYKGAAASHTRALALLGAGPAADPGARARALIGLGEAQSLLGDYKAAETNMRAALALDTRRGGSGPEVARDLEMLGENAFYAGDLAAGRRDLERGMALRIKAQGATHPRVIEDLNNLASIAYMGRDLATAERYFRRALDGYEAVLGPDHPDLASALNNLGRILVERREFARAEPLLRRAVAIDIAQRGEIAGDLAFEYANHAIALRGVGRLREADASFAKAERAARDKKHRNLAPILVERAELACGGGQAPRGLGLLAEAEPIMARDYPDDPWRMPWLRAVRGACLEAAGRTREGGALLKANAAAVQARWPPGSLYRERLAAMLDGR